MPVQPAVDVPAIFMMGMVCLAVLGGMATLALLLYLLVRTRNLSWRVADLESAVRRLLEERHTTSEARTSNTTDIQQRPR